MRSLFSRLWNDDAGFIVSAELLFLFTITVLGLLVGWVSVRNAVVTELVEVANAIQSLDQSYSYLGIRTACVGGPTTAGSSFSDNAYVEIVTIGSTVVNPGSSSLATCIP